MPLPGRPGQSKACAVFRPKPGAAGATFIFLAATATRLMTTVMRDTATSRSVATVADTPLTGSTDTPLTAIFAATSAPPFVVSRVCEP
jgi:hypothetical protein